MWGLGEIQSPARECGETAGPQPLGASAPGENRLAACGLRRSFRSGGLGSWVLGLAAVLPHQCKKKRLFLQPASRRLQSAEKTDKHVFISALPGLKSGARRSKSKHRFLHATASRERKLPVASTKATSSTTRKNMFAHAACRTAGHWELPRQCGESACAGGYAPRACHCGCSGASSSTIRPP